MKIHQIYTHNQLRNFTYIIELNNHCAMVIDPWDDVEINRILQSKNLSLKAIINTHEHWDHTQGNAALVEKHSCQVWAHSNGEGKIPGLSRTLQAGEKIDLDENYQLLVLDTPGHTVAHLCFIVQQNSKAIAVFTGDTLFNAGVGRCDAGGSAEVLYQTISQQFQTLDDDVIVYPGHDYLENNLKFTLKFELDNRAAKQWLEKVQAASYKPSSLQTTIGNEKSFNTFMRLNNRQIIKNLSLENPAPKEVFLALRAKRDRW